jgi:hypothetical protein
MLRLDTPPNPDLAAALRDCRRPYRRGRMECEKQLFEPQLCYKMTLVGWVGSAVRWPL